MSGGSFNYLCFKSFGDLFECNDELAKMIVHLEDMGQSEVADHTRAIRKKIMDLQREYDERPYYAALKEAWRAIEWCVSCDTDEDHVKSACAEFCDEFGNGANQ